MADILQYVVLRGHTYSDKDGIVKVYTRDGAKPSRKVIFKLLAKARVELLEGTK